MNRGKFGENVTILLQSLKIVVFSALFFALLIFMFAPSIRSAWFMDIYGICVGDLREVTWYAHSWRPITFVLFCVGVSSYYRTPQPNQKSLWLAPIGLGIAIASFFFGTLTWLFTGCH